MGEIGISRSIFFHKRAQLLRHELFVELGGLAIGLPVCGLCCLGTWFLTILIVHILTPVEYAGDDQFTLAAIKSFETAVGSLKHLPRLAFLWVVASFFLIFSLQIALRIIQEVICRRFLWKQDSIPIGFVQAYQKDSRIQRIIGWLLIVLTWGALVALAPLLTVGSFLKDNVVFSTYFVRVCLSVALLMMCALSYARKQFGMDLYLSRIEHRSETILTGLVSERFIKIVSAITLFCVILAVLPVAARKMFLKDVQRCAVRIEESYSTLEDIKAKGADKAESIAVNSKVLIVVPKLRNLHDDLSHLIDTLTFYCRQLIVLVFLVFTFSDIVIPLACNRLKRPYTTLILLIALAFGTDGLLHGVIAISAPQLLTAQTISALAILGSFSLAYFIGYIVVIKSRKGFRCPACSSWLHVDDVTCGACGLRVRRYLRHGPELVGSASGSTVHTRDCPYAKKIRGGNDLTFTNLRHALDDGRDLCSYCLSCPPE